MTVDELLRKLAGAFPAFNAKALEAWGPVFRARFGKREGPHLAEAYMACLSSFDPAKTKKLFPTPPDLEAHMPSIKSDGGNVVALRPYLEKRQALSRTGYDGWSHGQGAKIRANRPAMVASACALMAMEIGKTRHPLILTAEEIALCEERAVSTERSRRYGPRATAEEWQRQVEEIRTEWQLQTGAA